jgi:methionine biosynthesis protein MetW
MSGALQRNARIAPLRPDLQAIAELVPSRAGVLDLGCGDGALLESLKLQKQVRGRGIELSEEGVLACVRRGLSVRQGDLGEGLADYPDGSFDIVILAQTLPFLDDPAYILGEMLRVGRQAIVSFPNWGSWRCRLDLLFTGRMPPAADLPQQWYEAPRRQPFTITDFAHFCDTIGLTIEQELYLAGVERIHPRKMKNLRATTAVFSLSRTQPRNEPTPHAPARPSA